MGEKPDRKLSLFVRKVPSLESRLKLQQFRQTNSGRTLTTKGKGHANHEFRCVNSGECTRKFVYVADKVVEQTDQSIKKKIFFSFKSFTLLILTPYRLLY